MSRANPQQKRAIQHCNTPLLVLAGAGSGKTYVITKKIAWLINQAGYKPSDIYAVTFTNKAAKEMRDRVKSLLKKGDDDTPNISTFHSLGLAIIRQEHDSLGYKSRFSIFDSEDCARLVRDLMRTDLSGDKSLPDRVRWQISAWKNELVTPDAALQQSTTDPIATVAARIYPAYQENLKAFNAVDFDDLIMLPVLLFNRNLVRLNHWRNKVRYLLVDEYQDTNTCQYALVRHLTGKHNGLTAVGDDDQSIYVWRGARPENLAQLNEDYPDLTVIKLEQNYRSTGRILKAANAVIANNEHMFEKKLWSELGYGDPIRVIVAQTEQHEAEQIAADLHAHMFQRRNQLSDYAILYRSNHQSRLIEHCLRERNIPYYVSGGTSFFERTEIKDIMAYVRLITNPDDDAAFLRSVETPRRHIGPATLEKLGNYAKQRGISLFEASSEIGLEQVLTGNSLARLRLFIHTIAEFQVQAGSETAAKLVRELVERIDYADWLRQVNKDAKTADKRMENVHDLIAWIERMQQKQSDTLTLYDAASNLSLLGMLDQDDEAGERVALMTLHAAKGLEFPHVYIVGMEENILPHHNSQDDDGISEERRLAYVGITRARKTLCLSYAQNRKRGGERVDCEPSRYLSELPKDDVQWEGLANPDPEESKKRGQAHLDNLRALLG
ncbi:MAG: UvrD-helicase domain-containing protein [Gammaproteobacteria bacterium]|nr:UvrD-helicase domain-containing protein [Gammaproteobacteria bacterium]